MRALAADGRTVLVSSHLMSEMAQTADRLIVIGRGRLIADTTTAQLIESSTRSDVLVRSPRAGELACLMTARSATVLEEHGGCRDRPGRARHRRPGCRSRHRVHALIPRSASIEEAYLDLTGPEHRLPRRQPQAASRQPQPGARRPNPEPPAPAWSGQPEGVPA